MELRWQCRSSRIPVAPLCAKRQAVETALFSSAQADHRGRTIKHLPVVLQAPALFRLLPRPAIAMHEGEALEDDATNRFVRGTIVVCLAFD